MKFRFKLFGNDWTSPFQGLEPFIVFPSQGSASLHPGLRVLRRFAAGFDFDLILFRIKFGGYRAGSAGGTKYPQLRVKRSGTLGNIAKPKPNQPWKGGVIAAAIALIIISAGCGKQENVPQTETATSGSFQLVADEVLRPAVDSLVTGFMTENPDAKVTVKYTSAAEAVRELLNHDARAILIDRRLTLAEQAILQQDSATLPIYPLAWDGIGVIVAAQNPLDAIAKSDLAKIMKGTISNWSGLARPEFRGGSSQTRKAEGAITIALPAYPSSVEYVLDSILASGAQTKAVRVLRFTTSDSIIAFVRHSPNAIGFIGSAWDNTLTASGDTSVRTLPVMPADSSSRGLIEPVLLNMAYVAEGLYPLVTKVNGYSFDVPNTIPRGFLAYASTAHGQIVFKNFNVLPITQPIKLVPSQ